MLGQRFTRIGERVLNTSFILACISAATAIITVAIGFSTGGITLNDGDR